MPVHANLCLGLEAKARTREQCHNELTFLFSLCNLIPWLLYRSSTLSWTCLRHILTRKHEVKLHESMYSPDTSVPRPVSPEFVPTSFPTGDAVSPGQQQVVGGTSGFLASVTTPLQQPLLSDPAPALRCPCKSKVILPSVQRHSARLARKRSIGSRLETFA